MPIALMSHAANMPGYNSSADLNEAHTLSSYPQSSMASNANGIFAYPKREPSSDMMNGSSWQSTGDGPQNFPEYQDNGSSHSGDAEDYLFTSGHTTPRGSRLEHTQSMDSVWTTPRITSQSSSMAQVMSRADSSRSSGSSLSQSSQMSRGNADAFRNAPPSATAPGTMAGMDSCLLVAADAGAVPPQMYWVDVGLNMNIANATGGFAVSEAGGPMHMAPEHMHLGSESVLPDNSSPGSWDCFSSSISRTSSPATIDDVWLPSALTPNSPEIAGDSPSAERKVSYMSDTSKPAIKLEDDLGIHDIFASRRHGSDGESSARDHALYKNATTAHDGLFHCPWEGQASCNHRPEKLKCNYDKFVDSHLKPYRCKAESCEGARFSSTACLLRHEREAHGLHGHGEKPFLCIYDGCERAISGNGFPRQWNLRDHMKRVHNDHGSFADSPPSTRSGQPTKGRKRKTETAESQSSTTRKATLKSMPVADSKRIHPKPLLDQWLDQRREVEEIVRSLNKPSDARNLQQIDNMQKRLTSMANMTKELSAVATNILPNINRRTYSTG